MIDFEEVFCTNIGCESDPRYNSPEEEMEEFFLRQNLIFNLLENKEYADTVLDCLEQQGIDPLLYLESLEKSINWVVENKIQVTNAGLWVPQY